MKDKIDLSAFNITGLRDLTINASAANNADLHISAKNNEFDGRIILTGVLNEGDDVAALVADSFIFA